MILSVLADIGLQDGLGPDDVSLWLGMLVSISILIGGLFAAVRVLKSPMTEQREQLDALREDIRTLRSEQAAIKAQVMPNGGASMRDSIARIEGSVGIIQVQQKALGRSVDEVRDGLSDQSERLDRHMDAHRG